MRRVRVRASPCPSRAFTLIELLVVLAIVALLVSIVAPTYFHGIAHARETSLRTSLNVMRDAIDKFAGDLGRYPDSLEELERRHYIRKVPVDPITGRSDTWVVQPPLADDITGGQVGDIRSGADGAGSDGEPYADY